MALTAAYRVVIVDDERIAREGLRAMLSHDPQLQVMGEARDGEGAIRLIRQVQPDIVFVDVRMPGPDGFGVLRAVSTFNRKPAFIFVTAYPARALDAYDADAVDYLLKPFNAARLSRTVQRAIRYLRGIREPAPRGAGGVGDERLLLRTPDGAVFVDADDVTTVTVERNYLRVRTAAAGEYVVRQTLASFARNSPVGYLRISRSTLVNLRKVRAVRRVPAGRFAFEFPDGTSVVSSRRYRRQMREVIRPA